MRPPGRRHSYSAVPSPMLKAETPTPSAFSASPDTPELPVPKPPTLNPLTAVPWTLPRLIAVADGPPVSSRSLETTNVGDTWKVASEFGEIVGLVLLPEQERVTIGSGGGEGSTERGCCERRRRAGDRSQNRASAARDRCRVICPGHRSSTSLGY